jgi:hypothetical protein
MSLTTKLHLWFRMAGFVKACEKDHYITVPVQIFYRSSISNSIDKITVASPYLLNYQKLDRGFSKRE